MGGPRSLAGVERERKKPKIPFFLRESLSVSVLSASFEDWTADAPKVCTVAVDCWRAMVGAKDEGAGMPSGSG